MPSTMDMKGLCEGEVVAKGLRGVLGDSGTVTVSAALAVEVLDDEPAGVGGLFRERNDEPAEAAAKGFTLAYAAKPVGMGQ